MDKRDNRLRAWSHLLGAQALALGTIERRLKARRLPPIAWYDVLLELERAGGRLRAGELSERLVIEPYNVTRLLDRLTAEALVRRGSDPDDGRVKVISITEKGTALRRKMWPAYQEAIVDVMGGLGDVEAENVVHAMKKVIAQARAAR